MCEDMGSMHESQLLHIEVSSLSRCRVFTRLMELRAEVEAFSIDHTTKLATLLNDEVWLRKLSYLAYSFSRMNEMNLSLQEKTYIVFDANTKASAYKRKLTFCSECVEKSIAFLVQKFV